MPVGLQYEQNVSLLVSLKAELRITATVGFNMR